MYDKAQNCTNCLKRQESDRMLRDRREKGKGREERIENQRGGKRCQRESSRERVRDSERNAKEGLTIPVMNENNRKKARRHK
eukprot:1109133-Amorphochlora_amoeboformis.AAC.1